MNMIEAVKAVFSKYATFEGRARRAEYWWFVLFSFIIAVVLNLINPGLLGGIWSLATLLPSLAVGARRLHDTDRSGWWLLIGFIPVIGLIVLIVFFASRGQTGANRFGADPLTA
ncbi:MAG: DUF805 domain-containing protein [Fuscovulum sp.]|jgi:uncharacterized membrane protein YhaH (DUF805 family)|nr:DUF805 domain-containing protein [Paracoccaceae bacterium]MCZ8085265.1 DUF805 domain-containing protein [Paracoccaceae bacterium]WRH62408.1 MAG: DUF805 domain-containing protein [Fuscovulum sp.]